MNTVTSYCTNNRLEQQTHSTVFTVSCCLSKMWASKVRTYLPYIATGAITAGTTLLILRKYSKGAIAYASAVQPPVKPFQDTRVVIVGAGYGGINLAQKIKNDCQLTLIDARDSFHHNMGAQRSANEEGYVKKCLIPFQPTFGDKFKRGKVVGINVVQKTVQLASGERIGYDELVIATGTTGPFLCKLPVDIDSKDVVLRYESILEKVQKSQNIVVIGGGAAGVELSGDIKEDYKEKHVTLIHPREAVVNDKVNESFQSTVKDRLKFLGVQTILGERVTNLPEIHENGNVKVEVKTNKNSNIKADLVIECTGLRVNSEAYKTSLANKMDSLGRLKVDQYLGVEDIPNVYAIGDCSSTPEIKLAKLAMSHASYMGNNLKAKHAGKEMKPYKMDEGKSFIISCGRSGGAVQMGNWVFGDWLSRTIKGNSVFTPMQWKTMEQKMPE